MAAALSARGAPEPTDPERAWAAQLHLHGPFSEGTGSIDSHSVHNRGKVDVLWWSDHDFRIGSYRCASRFGFEAIRSALDEGESWTARWAREEREKKWIEVAKVGRVRESLAEITDDEAYQGERCLRVAARGPAEAFGSHLWLFETARNLQRRPLAAQVTLQVAVLAEQLGPDAHGVVEVELSEHVLDGELVTPHVRFVIGAEGEPEREGLRYRVPIAVPPGEWQLCRLPLTAAVAAGFPEFFARDNSLRQIYFGVEARRGARASVLFDDFRILQEHRGSETYAAQREVLDEVGATTPYLVHLQGSEISYVQTHINEFSLDTRLPDYDRHTRAIEELHRDIPAAARKSFRHEISRRAIEDIHARGGLASYNHMFGATPGGAAEDEQRELVLERLVSSRVIGADLLEVGYRHRGGHSLEDHLWVWDQLAAHGIFVVGTGVSDSHGLGQNPERANNMISWIYAATPTKPDLIEGMRRGRVFFGDPDLFDGTLDLVTARGARMGSIVVTQAREAVVGVEIEGLRPGYVVSAVGAREGPRELRSEGSSLRRNVTVALDRAIEILRIEVRDASGRAVALSNPLTFVRDAGVADSRLGSGRIAHD